LVGRFNSGISRTLARNASLFAEINSYLEKQGHKHLGEVGAQADMDFLIDISRFKDAPLALRKQMAREAIRRVKGDLLDISHSHIQAMLAMVGGTSGKQLHLPGNIRIVREFDHLRIGKGSAEITKFEYELQPPGYLRVTELEKAVCIRKVKTVEARRGDLLSTRFKRIVVRNRRPGDRYLISTEKEKTLKRLFLENRVPISRRDRLVLLESEENLIWVEGFPVNPTARAGDSDSEGFEIEVTDETFGPGKPSK
jgi:tRNA(Ile)-lysidine synthase